MTLTGTRGDYTWQESEGDMGSLLAAHPEVVERRYVVITHTDNAHPFPLPTGWHAEGGLFYTSRIERAEELHPALHTGGCCGGHFCFPEAYVFDAPVTLSELSVANVFEAGVSPERVFRFVTFVGFRLAVNHGMEVVTDLLWDQIAWIRPYAYIAAGDGRAYLVTRNPESASNPEIGNKAKARVDK